MKINRNLIILFIFLAFLATLFLGRQIFFSPQKKLQVVNTIPLPGQNNIPLDQEITLEFNQVVNPQDITISFFPEFLVEIKEENQKIIIKPKENLLPQTQYRLELKDKAERPIFSLVFETTAEEISPTPLPLSPSLEATVNGKGDPNAHEEMAKKLYQEYPLYNLIPYRTTTWFTDYAAPKKLLIIYKKGEDLSNIQEEVFAWIWDNNIDPKTHLYVWEEREVLP